MISFELKFYNDFGICISIYEDLGLSGEKKLVECFQIVLKVFPSISKYLSYIFS